MNTETEPVTTDVDANCPACRLPYTMEDIVSGEHVCPVLLMERLHPGDRAPIAGPVIDMRDLHGTLLPLGWTPPAMLPVDVCACGAVLVTPFELRQERCKPCTERAISGWNRRAGRLASGLSR